MNRFYGRATRAVRKSWHMYPLGCLFGLGFDTATEVALLVLAGAGAASGLPFYAILCLPILFAAGMSLFDTIDGAFMNFAYGWAFSTPVRKIFYNLTITGLSVAVALLIGGLELLEVLDVPTGHRPQPRRLPGRRPVRAHVDALARGLALRADRGPLVGDAAMTRASDTPRLAFRDIDDVAAALRAAGGRFSAVRQRVLQAMFDADGPLPADAVAPELDQASVYRALEYLEELGAVRHVHAGHGPGPVPAHGRRRARVPRVRALPPRDRGRAGAARRRAQPRSRPSSACGRASRTSRSSACARTARGSRGRSRGDRRLAVGDPAVPGREPLGDEHPQARRSAGARRSRRAAAGWRTRRRTGPRCRRRAPTPRRRSASAVEAATVSWKRAATTAGSVPARRSRSIARIAWRGSSAGMS